MTGGILDQTDITSIGDILRRHSAEQPDAIVLTLADREVTWAELYERSCRVAQGLAAAGVGPHDRVAFLDKNGAEHFEVLFGASFLNAVSVDVNWRLAPPEVQFIVDDADAKVVVVGPEFVPVLDAIADQLPKVHTFLVIGGHDTYPDYDEWVAAHPADDPHVPSAMDDVAFQLYSSGTTGRPKGVMLTNANFFGLAPMIEERWELRPDAVNLVSLPLFHIAGGGWALAGMYLGCRSVVVRDIDPVAIVRLIGEEGITHALFVPALLQFLLMVPGVEDADFSTLELIVYGASPISEDVLARCVALFAPCKFLQAYGLTETTGAVTLLPPEDHDLDGPNRHRLRSCGVAVPGVELRLVDLETGEDVPMGQVGEIWARGPNVMAGYWKMPDATAESITPEGWFRTGDAGYVDEDGYYYIHDRVKDMIVSGGENVYPAEVENALMAHPDIADVGVIGVPHEKWGESGLALVVRAPGSEVTEEEILSFAREHLGGFKCPTAVEWVDELPRNPSGKILKRELREPYWEGETRRVH